MASEIKNADACVIFGPAETKDKLNKELQKKYKDISLKVQGVNVADSMTHNQIKAWVRDFFKPGKKWPLHLELM